MDAACHAPGICVWRILCIVHFGWTWRDFGQGKDVGQTLVGSIFWKQGETFWSQGHFRFTDLFCREDSGSSLCKSKPSLVQALNPDLYQSLRQVRSWWDPGRADVTTRYRCPVQILVFRSCHAVVTCSTTHPRSDTPVPRWRRKGM